MKPTIEQMKEKREEFEKLSRPLIKFLNENFHPHMTIIITPGSAEILEGVSSFSTDDYIPH